MKILVLMAGARAGTEFLQSLLDGHKQILQCQAYFTLMTIN